MGVIKLNHLKSICILVIIAFSQVAFAQQPSVMVADLSVKVPGQSEVNVWKMKHPGQDYPNTVYYYGFQKGDEVTLNLAPGKEKGTFDVSVTEYPSGSAIYSMAATKKLKDVRFLIPEKAVYKFSIQSSDPVTKTCRLSIRRKPAQPENRLFNTHVTWVNKPDTVWTTTTERVLVKQELTPEMLIDKTFRVYSLGNLSNPSRTFVRFKLPPHTRHWVYWVGVGQESVEQLKESTKLIAKGSATAAAMVNPVAAFGLGLIPYLPQVNASGNIDYYFMSKASADKFVQDGSAAHFSFAKGKGIVSDYMKVPLNQTPKTDDGYLYMCFENNNTVTGLDVALKIVAFVSEEKYVLKTVKKPLKVNTISVPQF